MDITKYMHMKNRHCSHIFLAEGSCIAPWGHDGSIALKLYNLLVVTGGKESSAASNNLQYAEFFLNVMFAFNQHNLLWIKANTGCVCWCTWPNSISQRLFLFYFPSYLHLFASLIWLYQSLVYAAKVMRVLDL